MSADPLETRATPRSAAAYWLNRKRAGDMSAYEQRAFQAWLDRDPANADAFAGVERMWAALGEVVQDPAIMASRERDARVLDRPRRLRWAGLAAAGVAVAALAGWAALGSGMFAPMPSQEFRTTVGQRATVKLLDGSIVTLDTDTLLSMRETHGERHVDLDHGRAYFRVAKDPSRPFIVAAAGRSVRATGTAFDVRVDPDRLLVTLVEGKVRVSQPRAEFRRGQYVDLTAGWRLNARTDGGWSVARVDLDKETSWHSGMLTFFRDPLAQAVGEMNRYSEKKIVFRGGQVPDKTIVGVFRAGDVDSLAKAIRIRRLARVAAQTDDRIELSVD